MTTAETQFPGGTDIRSVLAWFAAAYNAGDAQRLAAPFEPDAVFVNIAADRADGRPAIEAMHADAFQRHLRGTVIEFGAITERRLEPSVALAHGKWVVRSSGADSGTSGQQRTGMLLFVLRRSDERWWIAAAQNTQTGALPPG